MHPGQLKPSRMLVIDGAEITMTEHDVKESDKTALVVLWS